MDFREGDLFRWSYKQPRGDYPYHCCSRIAEFCNGLLIDTYWSNYRSGIDGRRWKPEEALEKLNLAFKANRADLIEADESAFHRYRREDIVDLRHPNNSRDDIWVRRGAKECPQVMRAHLEHVIERTQSELEYARDRVERCRQQLQQIEAGEIPAYLEWPNWRR